MMFIRFIQHDDPSTLHQNDSTPQPVPPTAPHAGRWLSGIGLALSLLAVSITLGGCNMPRDLGSAPTLTPYIIYVTATPEGSDSTDGSPPSEATMTPTPLPIGPFLPFFEQATSIPPTLDPSIVTLIPTQVTQTPGSMPELPSATPSLATQAAAPLPASPPPTLTPKPTEPPYQPPRNAERFGINFISSAQHQANRSRFKAGIGAGATWDRFAIYWSEIEQEPDQYVWDPYDEAVSGDVQNGLRTNAILLGTPPIYAQEGNIPKYLGEPVFADGTDKPGRSKSINPNNPWAEFVFAAVNRYKPGGELARSAGWPDGRGIRVWEIWNEPDFSLFWGGSVGSYARLLKVAHLAARHADPEAQIMLGGLVWFEKPGFLIDLLNTYKKDPDPVEGTYPFDIVALHSYSHPPYSFYIAQRTQNILAVYGLGHVPIWLNESGVTVWDDYPGPTWASRADQIVWRATLSEQADYVIQNAALAFMAEVEVVFHFQLYDDCGNQPRGTTFPPHDGSLCVGGAACWGDALGLVRNSRDNACFNQGPAPDTHRPAYDAFRTISEIFTTTRLTPISMFNTGPRGEQRWLAFARPKTSELVVVLWNESDQPSEAVVLARAPEATLVMRDGSRQSIQAGTDNTFRVMLSPATNRNVSAGSGIRYMIGGPPVILIEQNTTPMVSVLPMVERSSAAVLVRWRSSDPNLELFEVWYRDETSNGDWVLWLESDRPGNALFAGGSGRTYSFFARGRAKDGQWTSDQPVVQATTTIE